MKAVKQSVLTIFFLLVASASHAVTIQVTAEVFDVGGNTPFGLELNDLITLQITYDENDVDPSGPDELELPDFTFVMTFPDGSIITEGSLTLAEADVTETLFTDQLFEGFLIEHEATDALGAAVLLFSDVTGMLLFGDSVNNPSGDFASAEWDLTNVQVVPLPAAVWFFGSALLGLGALRRVRRQPAVA